MRIDHENANPPTSVTQFRIKPGDTKAITSSTIVLNISPLTF